MRKSNLHTFQIRHGLSLVEIMIAMVMTLIVLGAMMAAFSYGSAEMQKGRASIELNNRLITAEEQLRRDLDQITVELKPYHQLPSLPKGYFELVEGPQTDYIPENEALDPGTGTARFQHQGNELIFGDRDDFVGFTVQSDGTPFRGRQGNQIVESHFAEVVWFTVFDPSTPDPSDVLLVRRQLLILPNTPTGELFTAAAANLAVREDQVSNFIANNDISVHVVRTVNEYRVFANNLSDLALRGNRFSHTRSLAGIAGGRDMGFEDDTDITTPPPLDAPNLSPTDSMLEIFELGNRFTENHVLASGLTAFNIQVFDPGALNLFTPNAAGDTIVDIAEPGSIGVEEGLYNDDQDGVAEPEDTVVFDSADRRAAQITGAYVDLGKTLELRGPINGRVNIGTFGGVSNGYRFGYNPDNFAIGTEFNGYTLGFRRDLPVIVAPAPLLNPAGMIFYETYDTGTSEYNRDSFNDLGSNGVDDNANGVIDEPAEQNASAPYNAPIRGLRFSMRVIEPNTNQVRQLTVKKSFSSE